MTINKKLVIIVSFIFSISLGAIIPCTISHNNCIKKDIITPRTSALVERRAYAIIVGIEDYPDPWSDLSYCVDDANSIYSKIYNNYGIDDTPIGIQYIQILLNSEATIMNIDNAFSHVAHFINPYDVFFFYFSGHGHTSSIPSLAYLCPYDTNNRIYSTDLDAYLDSVNCSEQYIFIDACGGGGMLDDASAPNRYFMTACQRNEDSLETSALGHGVFTYYFLNSFTSASDSNGDGIISFEEQFDYTYPRTVSYSSGLGYAHHPQEYDGITGESVIDTTIGSMIFTPNGTQLDYSFFLYGHGLITTIEITVCCAESFTIEIFDIISEVPSNTGFGFYSGTIISSNNISGYKIKVVADWPKSPPGDPKVIQHTFGDTDGDNLTDLFEINNGLNPLTNDTDSDDLDDYFEFYGITDPTLNDTDVDGMLDGYEVFNNLDPLTNDTMLDYDGDGLINIVEHTLGTYANNPDTDGDSMDDLYEYMYGLDLFSDDAGSDFDGDGLSNGIECQCGSMANNSDSDGDTMLDLWEYNNDLDLLSDDTGLDLDNDGLTNLLECQLNSYANNNDTDGDTMPDGWEHNNGLNLFTNDTHLDPDQDGLSNLDEYQIGTDPQLEDTDGDTWNDGDEIAHDTDPIDPNDYPQPPPQAISGYFLISILSVIIICGITIGKRARSKIKI
ncbi:MAG: caspase family protein [Candidatus Hodarchaeota archaeon]